MLQSVFCKKYVATEMRQIVCIRAGKATKNKANNKVLIDKREGLLTLYVADSRTVHVRWNHVYGWNHRYCWNAVGGCAVEDDFEVPCKEQFSSYQVHSDAAEKVFVIRIGEKFRYFWVQAQYGGEDVGERLMKAVDRVFGEMATVPDDPALCASSACGSLPKKDEDLLKKYGRKVQGRKPETEEDMLAHCQKYKGFTEELKVMSNSKLLHLMGECFRAQRDTEVAPSAAIGGNMPFCLSVDDLSGVLSALRLLSALKD